MNALMSAPPSAPAASLPRKLGRYTLFEHVGKGGMAEIYLARAETELGATRLAVVKQILPAYADDAHFSELLIHEAKLAARLSHKHIVQVFDLGRTGGEEDHLFIAMEYVEGFDLGALLRRCSVQKVGLPAPHALGIVLDVLHGLDYAHRRTDDEGKPLAIVHRDVSPSNVLISYEGEVKLCDFGIAHANDLVEERESEALKGKAGYMSPEQARGEAVDLRSDVFAAGIILWELLAGRRLYKPRTDASLVEQARRADIPPVPDKGLPSHDELAAIVGRALAVDRDARYASAAQFARDLESYLATAGLLASRLELGTWMAESFGTELVERRRASESRLPKSLPPTRPSERVAARSVPSVTSAVVQAAPHPPSITQDAPDAADEMGLSNTPEPSLPIHASCEPIRERVTAEPGSLAGASMDVSRSSAAPVDPHATERPSTPEPGPRRSPLALVMFLLVLAALVAIVWNATH